MPTVCFPFIGDAVGGSHISAAGLIRELAGTPFKPLVAVHQMDGPLAPWLRDRGIASVAAPNVALPRPGGGVPGGRVHGAATYALRTLPALVGFLKRHRVAIVHTNDGRIHALWGVAARLAGARLVWHHRGDPSARGLNLVAPLVADHIVTVSRYARPEKPVRPVGERLSVVHSPFERPAPHDRETERARLAAELGVEPDARFAACLGFLIERKRPITFVRTIARLRDLRPQLHGLVCGQSMPGDMAVETEVRAEIAALGVADRVHMMGFRQPVEPVIAASDVLVVPSVNEPFGRTLIEAMMLGTPVVAAKSGGNIEAIDDGRTGVLVPPDDVAGFAAAVERLVRDRDAAAAIAAAAHADAIAKFSVARHVGDILSIYERVLGSSSPRTVETVQPAGGW